jgi:hypothetical protein
MAPPAASVIMRSASAMQIHEYFLANAHTIVIDGRNVELRP